MKLSIIIPVFNEEKTIESVLNNISNLKLENIQKEIIVIDDGSQDNSKLKVQNSKQNGIELLIHKKNQGKGAAVKTGIEHATGDYIVIQDADLEYNPQDIKNLLKPILEQKAVIVYGTRLKRLPNFSRDERNPRFLLHYLGNKFLSLLTSILYGQWITDMETGYKIFPRKAGKNLKLHAKSFDFEPEITAKFLKKGYTIFEVPINTNPRGYKEGKKLNTFRDGFFALWTLIKYRFID